MADPLIETHSANNWSYTYKCAQPFGGLIYMTVPFVRWWNFSPASWGRRLRSTRWTPLRKCSSALVRFFRYEINESSAIRQSGCWVL